jgi:hypothetical protein
MTGKSVPLKDFMPADDPDDTPSELPPDEHMAAKLNSVMQQIGGSVSGPVQPRESNPADDAFRERMLKLINGDKSHEGR